MISRNSFPRSLSLILLHSLGRWRNNKTYTLFIPWRNRLFGLQSLLVTISKRLLAESEIISADSAEEPNRPSKKQQCVAKGEIDRERGGWWGAASWMTSLSISTAQDDVFVASIQQVFGCSSGRDEDVASGLWSAVKRKHFHQHHRLSFINTYILYLYIFFALLLSCTLLEPCRIESIFFSILPPVQVVSSRAVGPNQVTHCLLRNAARTVSASTNLLLPLLLCCFPLPPPSLPHQPF